MNNKTFKEWEEEYNGVKLMPVVTMSEVDYLRQKLVELKTINLALKLEIEKNYQFRHDGNIRMKDETLKNSAAANQQGWDSKPFGQ